MSKSECEFDTTQLLKMFNRFDEKSRQRVFRSTLRTASGILVRETRKRLTSELGAAANHPNKWNGKKMTQGVYSRVSKSGRSVKVSIMGDFRLKFFELGTGYRYTLGRYKKGRRRIRKGAFRGSIKPLYFFKQSKAITEAKVFSSIEKALARSIERINNKKYG